MVQPNTPRTSDDQFLMKMSQLVMMGIGFLAIWGGVFSVAFDDEATNQNFLILFVGGLASFLVAIGLIEIQSKKNGYHLYDIQNYFLGIAFFFSTVGVLWGTRYLMGFVTGTLELDWFGAPALYTEQDWSPNANGIYAQTITCLLLTYGHYRLLKRYKGDTSFGWGVATYAPMAVLIAGVGPWIRWSENVVSWELGLAIISITLVSMEMSLRSNKALNFVVVAFASGLVPLIYETLNSNAPEDGAGGALSLMVFIVCLQGYYAARQDLRKEVMERASILLIGQVVAAIALARTASDFNLILGPFRAGDYASLEPYVNIPVALWCAVLFAYFPAVLQQRVPWMPIGLAAALVVMPNDASTIPWVLSMLVLPYMVFISKVARAWVVNTTMVVFSLSYLLTDWYAYSIDMSARNAFGGGWLFVILPLFLLLVAELGRHRARFQTSTSMAMIGSVVLSRAILDPEWYLPWLLIAYMFTIIWNIVRTTPGPDINQRKDATLAIGFTTIVVLLLAILDNLSLPPMDVFDQFLDVGFRPQYLLLCAAMYVLSVRASQHELDAGSVFSWLSAGSANAPTFDATTGMWVVAEGNEEKDILEDAWTPLARFSLLGSLMMFTFSLSSIESGIWEDRPYAILVLALPVGMLMREVLSMPSISSASRAAAMAMLLFLAAPLSLQIGESRLAGDDLFATSLMLDGILVTAPLIVNAFIARRGLDEEGLSRNADGLAYVMLMVLALLDSSGGLLLIPLVVLVSMRTLQHNFQGLTVLIPLVFILVSRSWWESGLFATIMDALPSMFSNYFTETHAGPFLAIVGIYVAGHMGLALFTSYSRQSDDEASGLYAAAAIVWLCLGLLSALPDGYWIPTLGALTFMAYLWFSDKSSGLPYSLGLLYMALFLGFTLSETFQPITDGEAAGWSGILIGFGGLVMALMHQQGRLFRTPADDEEEQRSHDETASLAVQVGSLGFLAGFGVFYGVGPIIGVLMIGWQTVKKGQTNSFLLLPTLLTFSFVNVMVQMEWGDIDQQTTFAGVALVVQGLILTLLSAKDDLVYDFESVSWESDDVFFMFMDRLGVVGAAYTLIGLFLALNTVDLETIAYLLMTVYLVVLGVQGFGEETDARWRRGIGGYGSIVTAFLFANSIENGLFGAVGFVMMGMVALGFGFLFMQRMNEEDSIYIDDGSAQTDASPPVEPQEALEPVEEEDAVEDEPVADEADDTDEADVSEASEVIDLDEEQNEESEPATEQEAVEVTEEAVLETPVPDTPQHSGLLDTGEGFAVRLPSDAVSNIIATLQTTPHDGYVPVVAFGPGGQIMLTFEEAPTSNGA